MHWYKKSQFNEENTQNIDTPTIMVQPYEPIIQEVVNEMSLENPLFFKGINKINVDMGYGQFGSVGSENPADININIDKIKNTIGQDIDLNDPQYKNVVKDAIRTVIIHEKAHVSDASKAQEGSDVPLSGEELFPGGENVAEQAEKNI